MVSIIESEMQVHCEHSEWSLSLMLYMHRESGFLLKQNGGEYSEHVVVMIDDTETPRWA